MTVEMVVDHDSRPGPRMRYQVYCGHCRSDFSTYEQSLAFDELIEHAKCKYIPYPTDYPLNPSVDDLREISDKFDS